MDVEYIPPPPMATRDPAEEETLSGVVDAVEADCDPIIIRGLILSYMPQEAPYARSLDDMCR